MTTTKYLFRIGQGGMADVYLAMISGPARVTKLAVVKQLLPETNTQPLFRRMFLDEARIATRMNHPNVVQTFECSEERGELRIVMEYLEGQSLNRVMRELSRRDVTAPPELLVRILSDALNGLHYAHELRDFDGTPLRVVHRDVSPHNLFVTYDGQVKVVDFGIAKTEVSPCAGSRTDHRQSAFASVKTAPGVLKGKAAYMAPEQLSGDAVDRRADVFTAGTILWELLTMRRLMAAGTQVKTIVRVLQEPVPRVAAFVPDVDPELEAIVARALERDARRRFPTARAMRDALEAWLAKRPPVRPEQIGNLVCELFGDMRAHTDLQIRERIGRLGSAPQPDLPVQEEPSEAKTAAARPSAMNKVASPKVYVHLGALRRLAFGAAVVAGLFYAGHVASTPLAAARARVVAEMEPRSVLAAYEGAAEATSSPSGRTSRETSSRTSRSRPWTSSCR